MSAGVNLAICELERFLVEPLPSGMHDNMRELIDSLAQLSERGMRVAEHHARTGEYYIRRDGYPMSDLGQQDRAWRELHSNPFTIVPNTQQLLDQACAIGRDFKERRGSGRS